MNKKEQIKKIKELISMGNIVKVTKDNSFDDMAVWLSNDDKYIMWRCFGQSAVKNNLQNLTWLVNHILKANRMNISYQVVKSIYA